MAIKIVSPVEKLVVNGTGGTLLDVQGSAGQLFSVTDSLTGDLFAVSDISGIPILNVNSSGAVDIDGTLSLGDSDKIQLGASQDLQIYHDGSHSYIRDQGSGNLIITGSQLTFSNVADTEYMAKMVQDGTVELYYNGSKKLETTSTGVTVTGGLTADNLFLGGASVRLSPGTNGEIGINYNTSATGSLVWYAGGTASKFNVTNAGNATFAGTIGATNFSGSSSGTNTGDQDLSGYSTASGVEDNADVTDATNVADAGALMRAGGTMTGTLKLDSELQFLRGSTEYSNYIRAANYPSQNYTSSTAKYWLEYGAKGGHHFVLNTDGGAGSAENAYDDFTIWNGAVDGDRLLEVTNAGNVTTAGKLYIGTTSATSTATTALFLGAAGEVKKRGLGSNAFNSTSFLPLAGGTITGQVIFPSAATTKPVLPNGYIARNDNADTDGTHDIWGISERYYPSNSTDGDAWGIQWSGTPNEINFIGAGQKKLSIDLDTAGTVKIDGNAVATESYVGTQISNLVDSSPAALNTLNELAAALGDDASFSTTMSTALGNRLRIDVNNQSLSSTELANARTNLGLGTAATSAATSFVAVSGDSMTGVLGIEYNGVALDIENSANSGADTGIRIRGARNGQSYATDNLTSYILLSNFDDNTTPNNYDLVKIGGGMHDSNSDTGYFRIETNNGTALTKAFDIDKNQDAKFYGDVDADGNITATNFSGSSSGTNTGDQTLSSLGALSTSGGTITGDLTVNGKITQAGVVDREEWGRTYSVSQTNSARLITSAGNALETGGGYRMTGHISGTGTDQVAVAVFWNQNGTWYVNNTFIGGTSSNFINFFINDDGVPAVKTWHSNNYNTNVVHERLALDEGTGTDNLRGYFGADSYLSYNRATGALTIPASITATGGNSGNWNTAYGWGDHGLSAQDKTDIGNLSGVNTGDQTLSSLGGLPLAGGTMTGGLTISGSLSRGTYAAASNYKTGADNIVLKGNSVGRSGIFFESEKDGTNINHASDFGFIQFHSYGTGTTGESNELIIGVSNDTDDHLVFNTPNINGMKFRVGVSTTDYTVYHSGNLTVGDGELSQKNFTTTLKTKLDGVADNADVTPSWVPATDPSYLTSETFSSSDVVVSLSGTDVTAGESITLAGGLSYSGTTLTSANDNTTYTAGTGLTLSGTEFSVTASTYAAASHNHSIHALTARRSNVNIDNVGNDNFWETTISTQTNLGTKPTSYVHVVSFGDETAGLQFGSPYSSSTKLYYRQGTDNGSSENGANTYKNWRELLTTSGGTMTGNLAFNTGYTLSVDTAITDEIRVGNRVTLTESTDRADLLYINSGTSGWGGLQIGNTSNEFIFSLMGNDNEGGIYDDANGDWLIRWDENGGVKLNYNASQKLATTNTGVSVTGDIKIDSALLSNQENTDVDTGTETVATVAHATYTAAFFDYVIKNGTNVRAGTVYSCHDGTNVEFTETSTVDLGNTSDVTLTVDISGADMRLRATTTSDNWSVKSLVRAI
jgi:hypothetical protein